MGDESWFYMAGGTRHGPMPIDALQELFRRGDLPRETPVWCAGQNDWAPASSVGALRDAVELSPRGAADLSQVRPWLRFGARFVDVTLVSIIGGLFLGMLFPQLFQQASAEESDALLSMGVLFGWVFVESALLSTWGTTPGKWLLNVRLRKRDGARPSFSDALVRSFMVWWRGLGAGFPLVGAITEIVAYRFLALNGVTTWDRDGAFTIRHGRVGFLRVIAMLGWFAIFFWLVVLGQLHTGGGKELLTLRGHEECVSGVAWSPDGKRLATASIDRTAKVRDVASGKDY